MSPDELRWALLEGVRFGIFMLPYVIALVLGLAVVAFIATAWASPSVGVGGVMFAFLMDAVFPGFGLPLGVNLFLPDVICLLLGLPVVLRVPRLWRQGPAERLWLLFSAALLGSFLVGLALHRTAAGVEFRVHFYYWIVATYVMQFDWENERSMRVFRVFLVAMVIMMAVVCYRWAGQWLGFGDSAYWNEAGTTMRVVNFNAALGLAVAMLVAAMASSFSAAGRGVLAVWAVPLMLVVLLLQHRTAWAATLAGVVVLMVLRSGADRSRGSLGKWLLVGCIVVAVAALALGGGSGTSLERSIQEVGSQRSTLSWRTQSWGELLKDWSASGPAGLAFGKPYGSGFWRFSENWQASTSVNPHSNYIYLLLRIGAVGIAAMLAAMALVCTRLLRRRDDPLAILLLALVAIQLTAFAAYPGVYGTAFVVGLAFSHARRPSAQPAHRAPAVPAPPGLTPAALASRG